MDSRTLGRFLLALLLLVGIHAVAANDYQISSQDTTAVPERTVDFQGNSYTLETLIRADAGDSISLDVTAPDAVYRVYMYNSDEQIVDSRRGDGDGSFSFDLTAYPPGSYMLTAYEDGEYKALQPVLVRGYDVSTTAPRQVDADDTFQVEVGVTATAADGEPPIVEAVLANKDTRHVVTATQSGDTYTATIDAAQLSTGEYTLYGLARRTETVFGQQELVGMSAGESVQVGASETPTPTPTATPNEPTPTPTATPSTPTATPSTPTATPSTPTVTATPTATPSTPTSTPVTPTATPISPTPTITPITPTPTPTTPTATPISPTPTVTPVTPTPTPTTPTATPISPTPTITPATPTATPPPSANPPPGGGGSLPPAESTATVTQPPPTQTPPPSPPITQSPTPTADPTSPTPTESLQPPTRTRTETPESVLTPNQSTSPTGTQPVDETGTGFTAVHLLVVLCGLLVVVHRQTRQ